MMSLSPFYMSLWSSPLSPKLPSTYDPDSLEKKSIEELSNMFGITNFVSIGLDKEQKSGVVQIGSEDSKCRAEVIVNEYGGCFNAYGKVDDKIRASMQINEYGNGAIGLWDKDGYRLK